MEDLSLLPLHEVLIHNGFKLNRAKSSRNNPVVCNDKEMLVISKRGQNYLYFNTDGSNDRGNIINFCKNRNLDVRVLVQNYHDGGTIDINIPKYFDREDSYKNIEENYKNLNPYDRNKNDFFINKGLYDATIQPYKNSFKQDNYGNICFPHYKLFKLSSGIENLSICGYTKRLTIPLYKDKQGNLREKPLKNIHYGNKGLEILNINKKPSDIKKIVFTESIIDALSFIQLHKDKYLPQDLILVSTGGSFHIDGIKPTLDKLLELCKEASFITGFDNDEKGILFTKNIDKYILEKTKKVLVFISHFARI
ncbi:toprim domain-containing protein [Helicobacter sp. 13S00477-4]|uniref:toprim domain-containing protein n=1 Tax=Helicobacter sp. 13S00477-4 TaxID=1905759 RepID=UPI000BA53E93|nr:toprim domain-containing protein [Helicobacter sp. 13S00477-4]